MGIMTQPAVRCAGIGNRQERLSVRAIEPTRPHGASPLCDTNPLENSRRWSTQISELTQPRRGAVEGAAIDPVSEETTATIPAT